MTGEEYLVKRVVELEQKNKDLMGTIISLQDQIRILHKKCDDLTSTTSKTKTKKLQKGKKFVFCKNRIRTDIKELENENQNKTN